MRRVLSQLLAVALALFFLAMGTYPSRAEGWTLPPHARSVQQNLELYEHLATTPSHSIDHFSNIGALAPFTQQEVTPESVAKAVHCNLDHPPVDSGDLDSWCDLPYTNLIEAHDKLWNYYVESGRDRKDYCASLTAFRDSLFGQWSTLAMRYDFALHGKKWSFDQGYSSGTGIRDEMLGEYATGPAGKALLLHRTQGIDRAVASYQISFIRAFARMDRVVNQIGITCPKYVHLQGTSATPYLIQNLADAGTTSVELSKCELDMSLDGVTLKYLGVNTCLLKNFSVNASKIDTVNIHNTFTTVYDWVDDTSAPERNDRSISISRSEVGELQISGSAFYDTTFYAAGKFGSIKIDKTELNSPRAYAEGLKFIETPTEQTGIDVGKDFLEYAREVLLRAEKDWSETAEHPKTSFYGAEVGGSLTIKESGIGGNLFLSKINAGEVRLAGVFVGSDLDMWGAHVHGPSFFGQEMTNPSHPGMTILGDLNAQYANFDDIEIRKAFVGKSINFDVAHVNGQLGVWSTAVNEVFNANGVRTSAIQLHKLSASEVDLARSEVSTKVSIRNSISKKLWIDSASVQNLIANAVRSFPADADPRKFCPPASLKPDWRQDDYYGLSQESIKTLGTHPDGGQFATCIGEIDAEGLVSRNSVELYGYFAGRLSFEAAQIGGVLDIGNAARTAFGPSSCINFKGAKAESIVLDAQEDVRLLDSTKRPFFRSAPRYIDIFGASFRTIRPSAPLPRNIDRSAVAKGALSVLSGSAGEDCPERGYTVGANNLSGGYRPEVFDALAAGYDTTGNVDLARFVRIEKNRAYAAALPLGTEWHGNMPTRALYALADHINGFGYKNVNAMLWLAGFILIGAVLTRVGEARLQNAVDWILSLVRMKPRKWPKRERVDRSKVATSAIAFSLDRAIPSLGLDSAFGTHRRPEIGPVLSTWFYLQRTVCYVILALMIASAFNVFQ